MNIYIYTYMSNIYVYIYSPTHAGPQQGGSEAGSCLRLIDFMQHSSLGLRAPARCGWLA